MGGSAPYSRQHGEQGAGEDELTHVLTVQAAAAAAPAAALAPKGGDAKGRSDGCHVRHMHPARLRKARGRQGRLVLPLLDVNEAGPPVQHMAHLWLLNPQRQAAEGQGRRGFGSSPRV